MTRRAFLQLIGLAATTLVAAPTLGAAAINDRWVPSVWKHYRWFVQFFDFGSQVGVALELYHPVTGEMTRQAARFAIMPEEWRAIDNYILQYDGTDELVPHSGVPQTLAHARALLAEWSREEAYRHELLPPPSWWDRARAATPPGIEGDCVLEGNEFIHPSRPQDLQRFIRAVRQRPVA